MVRCDALDSQPWFDYRNRQARVVFLFLLILASIWGMFPAIVQAQTVAQTAVAQTTVAKKVAGKVTAKKSASTKSQDKKTSSIDLKSLETRLKQTLKKVTPSVVSVAGGSGVVVSEDGYVLTVAHVGMRAGRRVRVTFPDGKRVRGITLGIDRGVDAGLIKLDGDGPYPFAKMGTSKELQVGQWCIVLGYPVSFERGKAPAVRIGRVLSNRGTAVVTDCTIMGGDSGGPLFDMRGNVIGISSRCDDRLTVNIHVPVDCFQGSWDRLVKSEDFNSRSRNVAFLGVASDDNAQNARIGEVFPGTGAAKAGIRVGDVLLKFDGHDLSKYSELPPLILKHKPGDQVEIVLRRGKEIVKVKAKLGDRDE